MKYVCECVCVCDASEHIENETMNNEDGITKLFVDFGGFSVRFSILSIAFESDSPKLNDLVMSLTLIASLQLDFK